MAHIVSDAPRLRNKISSSTISYCAQPVEDTASMHEKERTFPFMHSTVALPQAITEYMKRKCAQLGTSLLTCRSVIRKLWKYFGRTTCSVDATLTSARWVSRFPNYDPAPRMRLAGCEYYSENAALKSSAAICAEAAGVFRRHETARQSPRRTMVRAKRRGRRADWRTRAMFAGPV